MPGTADEWVERRSTGPWGDAEEAALKAWLAADPANAEEFEVSVTFRAIPKFLKRFPPDLALHAFADALDEPPARQRGIRRADDPLMVRRRGAWLLGVSIALGIVCVFVLVMIL